MTITTSLEQHQFTIISIMFKIPTLLYPLLYEEIQILTES